MELYTLGFVMSLMLFWQSTVSESSEGFACFAYPSINFSVQWAFMGDSTAKVFKQINVGKLSAIYEDVWRSWVCVQFWLGGIPEVVKHQLQVLFCVSN